MKIDSEQIEKWENAIESEYQNSLKKIQAERDRKLDAVKIVAKLDVSNSGESHNTKPEPPSTNIKKMRKLKLTATFLFKKAINQTSGVFDLNTVKKALEQKYPERLFSRHTYNAVVTKMREDGTIRIVVQGGGTKPTTYEKIDNDEFKDI